MTEAIKAYSNAIQSTKWIRDCASELHLNLDGIRGIWPLPEDDELAVELRGLVTAAEAITRQLDELRDRTAEVTEKYLVRYQQLQRPGSKVKLRTHGMTKTTTLPDNGVLE